MAFEETFRWFGPNDPITLQEIKQTGAAGIVTSLHHIPVGEIWSIEEIEKRKKFISSEGLNWSVVESLPVHEDIKKRDGNYKQYINNYKQSIVNLAKCGIDTICYNFMPVLDWSRTNLNVRIEDGALTTKFEMKAFAAFDLFILKRKNSEQDYNEKLISEAKTYYSSLNEHQKEDLKQTILLGLPGSLQAYSLEELKRALNNYEEVTEEILLENLIYFLKEIIPAAEEAGIFMVIHPDDPPWSLLGLPRVVGSRSIIKKILSSIDSPSNGLTFCTGSLGASYKNDIIEMAQDFAKKINFIHLRNLFRNENGDFMESYHLEGEIDLYQVMKILLIEQQERISKGLKNIRMPMRPDHGHLMTAEQNKKDIYPGYSLFGRMRGLAELRGMQIGINRSLGFN